MMLWNGRQMYELFSKTTQSVCNATPRPTLQTFVQPKLLPSFTSARNRPSNTPTDHLIDLLPCWLNPFCWPMEWSNIFHLCSAVPETECDHVTPKNCFLLTEHETVWLAGWPCLRQAEPPFPYLATSVLNIPSKGERVSLFLTFCSFCVSVSVCLSFHRLSLTRDHILISDGPSCTYDDTRVQISYYLSE